MPALAGHLSQALDHLAARQDPAAGGFGADGGTDPAYTAWAAMSVAAAREDAAGWRAGRRSLRDAVAATVDRDGVGGTARLAVAASALGLDPRDTGGRNLVRAIIRAQAPGGAIGPDAATTAWGVIALSSAGLGPGWRTVADGAAALERMQRPDGGWSILEDGGPSTPITTADAIQALVAAGRVPAAGSLRRARAYLLSVQNPDGGFPTVAEGPSTALTTAWVTLAIRALGERSSRPPWGDRSGGPLALLARLQGSDGGVRNAAGSTAPSVWATSQAALAFAGKPLPLAGPVPRAAPPPDRAPRVLERTPLGGGRVDGRLVARYADDEGGTGIDPESVRLHVEGRDVTLMARVTSQDLVLSGLAIPSGTVRVRLTVADRAGNVTTVRWRVVGADR
ncbi:MAG: prenyltransferase/squalene oxidase repeat-containing protein [Thermoleophilia bacterium]